MHCAESAAELPLMFSHEVSGNPKEEKWEQQQMKKNCRNRQNMRILQGA